ncbi:MAG: LCP family protein [Christensenella sp.]|uniref:LCP family protein n=1 Tax=Christensenella sp. TaxID=1935934 RepID=UPI002B21E20B|nr:LCP family protein [Christensenella sp.]MEA5004661.1 LCP family protein [Christensenella sp.]
MNYKKGIKILTVILIVLVLSAGGVTYALYGTYTDLKANPIAAFNTPQPEAVASDDINFDANANVETVTIDGKKYQKNQNVVSILMLGIDWDGTAVKDATGARSDMIMLCTIDTENNTIAFLSIPRDTRTVVHKVNQETGKVESKEYLTKLNHAYILGGGNDTTKWGPQNTMRATEDLLEIDGQLSIPIQYYVSIDLEHLSDLAEALGGVEVTLDQDYPDIGSKGETITLEGNAVRLYLQNRKQMDDGEMSRQRHEQEFMMAIAKKIKKLGAVQSASKLFSQLSGNVLQTNLGLDQIVAMAGVLDKLDSIDNIKMETFEERDDSWQNFPDPIVTNPSKLNYFVMDEDELMTRMLESYYTPVNGGSGGALSAQGTDSPSDE